MSIDIVNGMNTLSPKIVHQGRGGYIEVGEFRFDIELMARGPCFAIYFPHRQFDKNLKRIREALELLVEKEPSMWVLQLFDTKHCLYDGMTGNERLYVAGLLDDLDEAVKNGETTLAKAILMDVEFPEKDAEAVIHTRLNRRHQ